MLNKTTTLDMLALGENATIKKVHGKGALHRRLLDLGFTSGTSIQMIRPSPLGDPVEYKVRGYSLTLRKSEGRSVEIEITS